MDRSKLRLAAQEVGDVSVLNLNSSATRQSSTTVEVYSFPRQDWSGSSSPTVSAHVPSWKRALDLTCILLALPALLPLMLLIALIIKAGSRGSVVFKQERIGWLGKPFTIYKFRTMVNGANTVVHEEHCRRLMGSNLPMQKLDAEGDSRLIPFGWWLRVTGLDELAQVINVLRGEMSLVGPRPCLPAEYEKYLPWQKERFNSVPGLTGLWQVSGKNRTTFDEMIRLDIDYARNKSLWLDLKIMLNTLPALGLQVSDMRGGLSSKK